MSKNKKTIKFNGEEFEIKPITIESIIEVGAAIENLPEPITKILTDEVGNLTFASLLNANEGDEENNDSGFNGINLKQIIKGIPSLIVEGGSSLPIFLSVTSKIPLDKIKKAPLIDGAILLNTLKEVNNFPLLVKELKNAFTTQKI